MYTERVAPEKHLITFSFIFSSFLLSQRVSCFVTVEWTHKLFDLIRIKSFLTSNAYGKNEGGDIYDVVRALTFNLKIKHIFCV